MDLQETMFNKGAICPFVGKKYEECYITQMSSQAIPKVLKYCSGVYEECEIYGRLTKRKAADY